MKNGPRINICGYIYSVGMLHKFWKNRFFRKLSAV